MVFSSTIFLFCFFPIVLIFYYNHFFKSIKFKNTVLIISSLFFYAWGEPIYVFLMLGSIFINWLFGLLVDKYRNRTQGKVALILSVIVNLGILFYFKYLTFTLENINLLFHTNFNTYNIVLPIGISFFTFQAMSYVIDVYRQDGEVQKNPLNVMLYISFFPQLIAGPIVRYQTIADQIKFRTENIEKFTDGIYRFMLGFFKKVFIANNVALVADDIFSRSEISVSTAWIGAVAYTLQIFFDFSGYSEMAIGLGKIFGFEFLENFDYPYISKSVTEFWRRWHISLGTWFRDYVYFPLGGSRVSKPRLVFNLFIVWFLTGLWHGANWTYIFWGIFFFVLLSVEKITGIAKKPNFFGHVYTMLFVIIGWVLFRAENIADAWRYLKTMFGFNHASVFDLQAASYLQNYGLYILVGIAFCFPIISLLKRKINISRNLLFVLAFILFVLSVSFTIKGSYNPFIYFNF